MNVLITGCSSGIGKELCERMTRQGFTVIATARNMESISDLSADMKLPLDVTDLDTIKVAKKAVQERYGSLDILINNAGFSTRGALEEISIASAQKILDVNVIGMIRMIQTFAPLFRTARSGKIINIGSVSGRYTQAANGVYCASKHAVEAISEAARYELAPYHVEVTVLEPGPMETEFFHTMDRNSECVMKNEQSPYYKIYQNNLKTKDTQLKCSAASAAEEIIHIISKRKLKARYFVALPRLYRMGILLHLTSLFDLVNNFGKKDRV